MCRFEGDANRASVCGERVSEDAAGADGATDSKGKGRYFDVGRTELFEWFRVHNVWLKIPGAFIMKLPVTHVTAQGWSQDRQSYRRPHASVRQTRLRGS